jgi:hypothetical protein
MRSPPNYDSTKGCFVYFGVLLGDTPREKETMASPFNRGLRPGQAQIAPIRFAILQATRLPLQARLIFFCGRPFHHARCVDRRG